MMKTSRMVVWGLMASLMFVLTGCPPDPGTTLQAPIPSSDVPAGVSAAAGDGQITVSWNAVSGATSYNLYWSTISGVTKAGGTKIASVTTPYVHTGLTDGITYYYVVTAVTSGGESADSAGIQATPSTNPMPAPTITEFTPTSGAVGDQVTITGSNFDTTAANNTVKFNGTTATVTSSTTTQIVTAVPSVATTGVITVITAGGTATSAIGFTVTTGGGGTDITKIAAGYYHSVLLNSNGTVWTWGHNSEGQLGDGTTTDRYTPVQVSGLTNMTAIAAGYHHTIALKNDGTVWAWGKNSYGLLGDGTTTDRYTPAQVSGLTNVTAIAAGEYHTLALRNDGTVWMWGYNSITPKQISGLTGVAAIAAGIFHSVALKNDGTVWAWGNNYYGQLGDGTTIDRYAPIQVSGLTGVAAIAGGYSHSLALKSDGTVWAWGDNSDGQLGDGTATDRYTPVQVNGLTGVIAIAGEGWSSLALKNDGTLWAWGSNYYGQLGDGTTTDRTTPVQVTGLTSVTAVAAGTYHAIALKNDGTLWTWGHNPYGELGDGTTTDRWIPVSITGGGAMSATKLAVNLSPPQDTAAKDVLLSTFQTPDGMHTALWGTKDNTGLPTSITQSLTWLDDPAKGFRVSYDSFNRPVQLYSLETGYSTRLIYEGEKMTCLIYDNSGKYAGGGVLTYNASTGEVTAAEPVEQTYSGTLSGSGSANISISTVLPSGTEPLVAASKANKINRAGAIDTVITAAKYIDAIHDLWQTDPDFRDDVNAAALPAIGLVLANVAGTRVVAEALGIAVDYSVATTVEWLASKYASKKVWDAALLAGTKMKEWITSLKARISDGEDVEEDNSLLPTIPPQPATVTYNSQTNWQQQNTPVTGTVSGGTIGAVSMTGTVDESDNVNISGTADDGSAVTVTGNFSITPVVDLYAGCSKLQLTFFANGQSEAVCFEWGDGSTGGGDGPTINLTKTVTQYPEYPNCKYCKLITLNWTKALYYPDYDNWVSIVGSKTPFTSYDAALEGVQWNGYPWNTSNVSSWGIAAYSYNGYTYTVGWEKLCPTYGSETSDPVYTYYLTVLSLDAREMSNAISYQCIKYKLYPDCPDCTAHAYTIE